VTARFTPIANLDYRSNLTFALNLFLTSREHNKKNTTRSWVIFKFDCKVHSETSVSIFHGKRTDRKISIGMNNAFGE
jgi:hypothetical protein